MFCLCLVCCLCVVYVLHAAALRAVAAADASDGSAATLSRIFSRHAEAVVDELWQLADDLMFRYADGYVTEVSAAGELSVRSEPYPDWWLK